MVWDLLLKTDPEGPALIFHAAYPHGWSVQIELLSLCVCSTLRAKAIPWLSRKLTAWRGHLCEIVDRLQAKGVALRILNMNLDTNDATGKLMLQIIGSKKARVAIARSVLQTHTERSSI